MPAYAEERGRQGRKCDFPRKTCMVMQKSDGDSEGDKMFREEHASLCRKEKETWKER
jgi:hypothetical protein